MQRRSLTKRWAKLGRTLAWGDALVFVIWAGVGLRVHHEPLTIGGVLRNAGPILLVWFLLAPFLRTYRRPSWRNLLWNWALAVVAGVWLRFILLNQPFNEAFFIFLAVTLFITLAFLLVWRALAALWGSR